MKITKGEYIEVEYDELEKLIEDFYGHEFSISENLDLNDDCWYVINVDGVIENYKIQYINTFKDSGYTSCKILKDLMNDLYMNEKLEKGKYLIRVIW